MNIRIRLTLLFILIAALIIVGASIAIYYFSSEYRREDFYNRLQGKGTSTAKLLIEVDEINAELLEKIEAGSPIVLPNEKIAIYNFRNERIFTTDANRTLSINDELLDQIRLNNEVRLEQGDYEILGFLYADKYDRFVVIVAATDIYGKGKLKNLRTILIIVFDISIIVVLLAAWIYAGRSLRPLSRLVKQADEITISRLGVRLEEGNGKDEIAQLAKTFNFVLDRLQSSFEIQKNFIANASHELRTPLTAITGQLEVTLLSDRTPEEYRNTIKSILEDIRNLNTLSNRLLLLAQASEENLNKSLQPLRIDEILWQSNEELVKRFPSYNITFDFDESVDDEAKLLIQGDEQLMKVVIVNLLENGCKYSPDNTVAVDIRAYEKHLNLTFTNATGNRLVKDDLEKFFEPFYRGPNSQNIRGHGIGLSLVQRILTIHNGSVKAMLHQNMLTISVRVPLLSI